MTNRTAVIIVNYKGSHDTAICLEHLYASQSKFDIIIVDNTPNDIDLIAIISKYPDVHLIRATNNLGFGQGNNLGIEWALNNLQCEYIFLLNNDAIVEPDSIHKLEIALDQHHDAGIAAPRIVFSENPNALWYGPGEVDWRLARGTVPGYLSDSNSPIALKPSYVTFASGCAMMIRRELLNVIGGFNPNFFMYEEDVELCLRASSFGYKIWYEPSSLIHHIVQGSLRCEKSNFTPAFSPRNPKLTFYVEHVIKNRIFNLRLHGNKYRILLFSLYFPLYLAKLTIIFTISGRLDGLLILYRSIIYGLTSTCR